MYYKIIKNNKVIDVLDRLVFLKYQPEHNIMLLCTPEEAQAVLSSDGRMAWHEPSLLDVSFERCDTVSIEEIDKYEYEQLKVLNYKTPEEIIDAFMCSLIEDGVI